MTAALFLSLGAAQDAMAMDAAPIPVSPAGLLPLHVGGLFGGGGGSSDEAPASVGAETPDLELRPAAAPRVEQSVINPLEALTPFLPAPGEWRIVQGLQFERFRLSDNEANAVGIRGTLGSTAVLSNRTGSAFDPEGYFWYFWGGGADAYGGNEVYRLDLAIVQMSQITQPSVLDRAAQVPAANNCLVPSDGPAAASTFDGFVWSPDTQSFFVFPSGGFCPGGVLNSETVWEFDPLMGTWNAVATMSGLNGAVFAEYDPSTGRIFVVSAGTDAKLREFDPVTGQVGAAVSLGQKLSVGNAVLDPRNDQMIVFAQEGVFAIPLADPNAIARLTDVPSGFDTGSGAAFDTRSGLIALWDGGKDVRTFDTVAAEWTLQTPASGPTAGPGGVFSKWIAIDELGIFLGYQNPAEGLWLYRLPTTTGPAAPTNTAPVAFLGTNQIAAHTGRPENLDGTGSFDPEGDPLTYDWSVIVAPAGAPPTFSTTNQATTTFTAQQDGAYTVRLTVSDGALSDSATVTVTAGNTRPVANAGADQPSVTLGDTVSLDGSQSADPDGDALSYGWTLTRPVGSNAVLSGASSAAPSFPADAAGTYTLLLSVSDGTLLDSDDVSISVAAAAPVNGAPVADAGPNQVLTEGQTATLTGLQSSDPDGDSLSYTWALTRPAGSGASLSSTTAAQPTLTLDVAGDYLVDLTVSDGQVASNTDQVKITANIDLGTAGGGSSGGGSTNTVDLFPGGSFEDAVESLLPGDTLIVHAGTYSDTGRISIQVKGTAAAPVVVKGADGEAQPVITRSSSASLQNTINVEGATYLTIKGLEIVGNGGDGISLSNGPSVITLEDLVIHDIDVGIGFRSSMSGIVVRSNHIYNTGIDGGTGEGMYIGCNNNGCAVSDTIIEKNLIHDNLPGTTQGDGIEVKPGSFNVVVRENVIHDMNYPCIFVYGNGPARNIVERNVMWNCNEAIQAVSDAVVRNNIILNSATGITAAPHAQVGRMDNMTIVNNTFFGHSDECLYIRWSGATDMVLANNAVYCAGSNAVNASGLSGAGITVSSNYVEGGMAGASIDNVGFIFGGNAGTEFADPAGFDLWPAAASVLRNAADAAHAPADDYNQMSRSNPQDVGAYETNGLADNPGQSIGDLAGVSGGGSTGGGSTGGGSTGGGSTGGGSTGGGSTGGGSTGGGSTGGGSTGGGSTGGGSTDGGSTGGGSANLIARWAFDDGSGTAAADATGGGNTGAVVGGPTWTAGALAGALDLNGSSHYVEVSDAKLSAGLPAAGTNPGDDFTVAAWVRLDSLGNRSPIVSKQGTTVAGKQRGFVFGVTGTGVVEFEFFKNDASGSSLNSSHSLIAGQWYHLAVTYDFIGDGTSQARIFVNGVESNSITNATGPVQGNNQPLDIGRYFWSSNYARYFDGIVDDVSIYGRALNTAEVLGLYNQAAGNLPPPVPTVALSTSPSLIDSGQSSTLSWSSSNATACSASGGWSGAKASAGSQAVTPSANATYTLTCTGPGGSASRSASVNIRSSGSGGGSSGGGTTVSGSSLAALAANLAPGQWGELQTNNINPTLKATGSSRIIFGFTDDMNWNPVTRQLQYVGGDHGNCGKFVVYSEATNAWTDNGKPSWLPCITSHGYDHNAVDPATGDFFARQLITANVHRWDGQRWNTLPPAPSPYAGNIALAIEYFPEMNGLLWAGVENGKNGGALLWDRATNSWRRVAQNLPMGPLHHIAEYNPVHKLVIFGGGDSSRDLYSLDAQGNVKTLARAPYTFGIQRAMVTVDPASGDYLVFFSNGQFWIYDVVADTWTQQSANVPMFTSGYNNPIHGAVATPVGTYGVVLFVTCSNNKDCKVMLYKHAQGASGGTGGGSTGGGSTGGGSTGGGTVVTDANFAAACAESDVILCRDFDTQPPDTGAGNEGVFVNGSNSCAALTGLGNCPVVENGRLKFSVPGNSWAAVAGQYFVKFPNDEIMPGESFYVRWDQEFDSAFLNEASRAGGGFKIAIFGDADQSSCATNHLVLNNGSNRGFVQGYHACGVFEGFDKWNPNGNNTSDFDYQPGGPNQCLRSYNQANGTWSDDCFKYVPDETFTFEFAVDVNPNPGQPSRIRLWVTRDSRPRELVIDYQRVLIDADLGYGAVWLLPYNTNKNTAIAHPEGHTWVNNLLVARRTMP